jgi:hypothetical protein
MNLSVQDQIAESIRQLKLEQGLKKELVLMFPLHDSHPSLHGVGIGHQTYLLNPEALEDQS